MKNLFFVIPAILFYGCGSGLSPAEQLKIDQQAEEMANRMIEKHAEEAAKKEMESYYTWRYEEQKDEMSDKVNFFASLTSPDIAHFDFPYGDEYLTLHVRNMGGQNSVMLSMTEGQFFEDYNNKVIQVRFDDKNAENYSVTESADADSKLRFISNSAKFIKNLMASKTMKIKAQFYNQGSVLFTFDTSGLKWAH
jgi:hypothetical protein